MRYQECKARGDSTYLIGSVVKEILLMLLTIRKNISFILFILYFFVNVNIHNFTMASPIAELVTIDLLPFFICISNLNFLTLQFKHKSEKVRVMKYENCEGNGRFVGMFGCHHKWWWSFNLFHQKFCVPQVTYNVFWQLFLTRLMTWQVYYFDITILLHY